MKKYYCVKVGRNTGIFNTWDECQKQVHKFPNAKFKAFTNFGDAQAYMNLEQYSDTGTITMPIAYEKGQSTTLQTHNDAQQNPQGEISHIPQNTAIAYVDGSFNIHKNIYGSGVIIFHAGDKLEFLQTGNDPRLSKMRNVAGEIIGAKIAMQYCIDHEVKNLQLFYDYEGIRAWAIGQWKTNKTGTIEYKAFYDDISSKLNVEFTKVKAHSNDKYNDEVDILAKKAAQIL